MAFDWKPWPYTAIRLVVPVSLWFLRAYVSGRCEGVGCLGLALIDACLVVTHYWANRPLVDANGGPLGLPISIVRIFHLPMLCAAGLMVLDGWNALRSIA